MTKSFMKDFIIGLEITKLSHKIIRALEAEIISSVDKNMSATTARIICFGVFGVKAYISSQTSNEIIYEMAVDYLQINRSVSFGCVFFAVFEKTLQATGHSLYSTIAQVTGSIINIILDPILIYGLFGVSAMGVKGAAYATVIGQISAFVLAYLFHRKFNKHIGSKLKEFKPNLSIIKQIYIIGFPAIVAQALISIMAYSLNVIFVMADESIVTVYGLYYKIQQFVIMTAFGLRDATMPIISFTYGTKNKQRLKDSVKYLLIYTFVIMIIGTILLEVFATPVTLAFGLSGSTMALFLSAIKIVSISFIFAGFNVACQAIFQAVDSGVKSLIVSFARQIVFVLPVAFIFTKLAINNFDYAWTVWFTFIIAEVITSLISLVLLKKDFKNKISTI